MSYLQWLTKDEQTELANDSVNRVKWLKERLSVAIITRDSEIFRLCSAELSSLLTLKAEISADDITIITKSLIFLFFEGIGHDTDLRCLDCLIRLLKRRDQKDLPNLTIDWKPLYDKLLALHFPKQRIATTTNRSSHGETIVDFIRVANKFFPKGSTNEILTRIRPELCPHCGEVFTAQALLSTFLPTSQPENAKDSIEWIDEVFAMWPWLENINDWNLLWLDLLSRLAKDQAGKVDLSKYTSTIFTNVLRLLELPVGSGNFPSISKSDASVDIKVFFKSNKKQDLSIMAKSASLIVYLLEPSGATQKMLTNLFRYIEPYYHPSNGGNWTERLAKFLKSLCSQFCRRIGRERTGEEKSGIPKSYMLSQKNINDFVSMVVPIICKAQYSKSETMSILAAQSAMQVSFVDPETVIPPILETVFPALETLTETHQTCSAFLVLGYLARQIVWRAHFPDGVLQLSRLLFASLPGIDINDMTKTSATLKFIAEILHWVPLIDSSAITSEPANASGKAAWHLTSMFKDWISSLLDRLFGLYNTQASAEKSESLEVAMTRGFAQVLFQSMGDEIHTMAVKKLSDFIRNTILPSAMKSVGYTVTAACSIRPSFALSQILPLCHTVLISENGGLNQLTDSELLWYLHIAEQSVKRGGSALLDYRPLILDMTNGAIASQNKRVVKLGCKLIKNSLRALTQKYPTEFHNFSPSVWNDPNVFLHWGEATPLENLNASWHVPSDEEIKFACEIVDTFGYTAMQQLESLLASESAAITPSTSPRQPHSQHETPPTTPTISNTFSTTNPPLPPPALSPAPPLIKFRAGALPSDSIDSIPAVPPQYSSQQQQQQQQGSTQRNANNSQITQPSPSSSPTPIYSRGRPFGASLTPALPQEFSLRSRSLSVAPTSATSFSTPSSTNVQPLFTNPNPRGRSLAFVDWVSNSGTTTPFLPPSVTPPPPIAIAQLWASKPLREQMWKLLYRLKAVVSGAASLLVDSQDVSISEISLPSDKWKAKWLSRWRPNVGQDPQIKCRVTKEQIGEFLHMFALRIVASHNEDDPSLLSCISKTIGAFCVKPRGIGRIKLVTDTSYLSLAKIECRDWCDPKRCFPRRYLVAKVNHIYKQIQLDKNYSDKCSDLMVDLLQDLQELSMNSFSKVRKSAQPSFAATLHRFPQMEETLIPQITKNLCNKEAKDWQVTGAAYMLHQPNILRSIGTKWQYYCGFLSCICQSYVNEKPTVQTRLYNLFGSVSLMYDDILFRNNKSLENYPEFMLHETDIPKLSKQDREEISFSQAANNERNISLFKKTISTLVEISNSSSLPPRYLLVISSCLFLLSSGIQSIITQDLLHFFLKHLISDIPNIRSICVRGLNSILIRLKTCRAQRKSSDIQKEPPLQVSDYIDFLSQPPPTTTEEWSKICFTDKNWIGWNGEPSPKISLQEANVERADEKLIELIEEAFWGIPNYIQALITGMINSKRPQGNTFSETASQFWKGLSQMFRIKLVNLIQPKLSEMISNTNEHSNQEVSAEIIAGIIRGSKHWAFTEQQQLHGIILPLIHKALEECPLDSSDSWAACIRFMTFDRDPRRLFWLSEDLLQSALQVSLEETNSSLFNSKRLKFLQQFLSELTWRSTSLNDTTLNLLTSVISHPYKQVRDRVAILLKVLFRNNWVPARDPQTRKPISSKPPILHAKEIEFIESACRADNFERCSNMSPANLNDPDFQPCMSFVRTIVAFVSMSCRSGTVLSGQTVQFFLRILPFLFRLRDHPNQDICNEVRTCLGSIAFISVPPAEIPFLFDTLCSVFESLQWHMRIAALPVLEVTTYRHVFLISEQSLGKLLNVVMALLSDSQLEVRERTSKSLAGILKLLDDKTVDLLRNKFVEQAKTPLKVSLMKRHGGILGIASVILSFPYDLPSFMPDLLLDFAGYISDPMPIRSTVKRTFMEFWRTHSDMWEVSFKQRFTSDQLSELTQLLVSPSYFA